MIRRTHISTGVALAAVAMLGACGKGGGANVAMEPGEWETTIVLTNVSLENLPPEMRSPTGRPPVNQPQTTRGCMAATADVVRIENLRFTIPAPGMQEAGCQIAELVMEGGTLRGRMSCNGFPIGRMMGGSTGGSQTMTLSGEMNGTYTPNSAQATAHGEIRFGERNGSGDVRVTSRRIGACPAPRPYQYTPQPMPTPIPPAMNALREPVEGDMAGNAM